MVQSATRHSSNVLSSVSQPGASEAAPHADGAAAAAESSQISLLTEVDFKWLMAGQGWHVDCARFQSDAAYAKTLLNLALESNCSALRDCANHILDTGLIGQL